MQTLENTKTVYDLVTNASRDYGEKIFLKYEDNDVVTAVTYSQFVKESMGIAAWIEEQNIISGHKIHVEPYEYYDRDALITTSAEVLKKIADGEIDAYSAFLSGDIQIEGNLRKELLAKVLRQ